MKRRLQKVLEMYTPRQFFGLCSNLYVKANLEEDTLLYAIGGYNEASHALNLTEVFNLRTRQWRKLNSMKVARINPGCCVFD